MGGRTRSRTLIPHGLYQARHVRAFFCAYGLPVKHAPARHPGTTRNVPRAVNRAAGRLSPDRGPRFPEIATRTVDREPGAPEKNLSVRAARTANRAPRFPEHGPRFPETLPGPPDNRGYSRRSHRVPRRENRDFFKIITKRVPVQISHKQQGPKTNAFN